MARLDKAIVEYIGHEREIDEDFDVLVRREAFRDGAVWQRRFAVYCGARAFCDCCIAKGSRACHFPICKDLINYINQLNKQLRRGTNLNTAKSVARRRLTATSSKQR